MFVAIFFALELQLSTWWQTCDHAFNSTYNACRPTRAGCAELFSFVECWRFARCMVHKLFAGLLYSVL